jgi:predicted Fe-S protein YdhL (DUF1289 family)
MDRSIGNYVLAILLFISATMLGFSSSSEAETSQTDAETCALRSSLAHALESNPALEWPTLQSACEKEIQTVIKNNPLGFSWFANAGNGFRGTPLVLQKILPDLAPEIWGKPDAFFSAFGLFRDPTIPNRILPRGLGITSINGRAYSADGKLTGEIDYTTPSLLVVSLACGSCHSGNLRQGTESVVLEGAPNSTFDARKWRAAFSETEAKYFSEQEIGNTRQRLLNIVDAKPMGFFSEGLPGINPEQILQVDASQRRIFKASIDQILTGFAQGVRVRAAAVALQQAPGSSYGHGDNSPGLGGYSAGQSDGSGDLMADLLAADNWSTNPPKLEPNTFVSTSFPELRPFATVTDIPSVWNQEDRAVGQWDGSVLFPFWRNIAAQLPIIGLPQAVDLENTHIVAEFLRGLPSPPYPFDIDLAKAAKGETLYVENCQGCHRPRNERPYWELHTDANRSQVLTPAGKALFLASFQKTCHDKSFTYINSLGRTIQPCVAPASEIIRDTSPTDQQGYIASPLDGIWARSPYLHNGSVPTLRHLLNPAQRPQKFLRGINEFDKRNLGWIWELDKESKYRSRMPTLSEHDTGKDGWKNVGHDKDLYIEGKSYRLDWGQPNHAAELEQLLEYLKTL